MKKIVTISREFGSGGREIGKRLSDVLNLAYYDEEIIAEISKETGLSEDYINNISEKGIYPVAFNFGRTFASFGNLQLNQTEILVKQQNVLKKIADKGDCIIVGRGADITLKDYNTMNIFVYSDMESKIKRCKYKAKEDEKLTDKELEKKIIQINKDRKKFHNLISNLEWGDRNNYNLCINTSEIEIKEIIPAIAEYIERWFRRKI
ncbi:MAG: cytidylate kinase-like family protein [Clostridia bacterium]|nr:cytidylate kinase-like family protein [Clostridia bacterium]